MIVTVFFAVLFLGMIGYLIYFTYAESDQYVTNAYNSKRQNIYADRYIRGDILSSDGEILATTLIEDEKELRYYPFGAVFAHVVGYSTQGSAGLESVAGSYLLSSHLNPILQMINQLQDKKSQGDTVVTTLDSRLQQAAYDALGDAQGAVVVLEVSTGKVLAMVSKPDYDPNQISEIWSDLIDEENGNSNLVNRATQGLYSPGSTFKILVALEYIRENPETYMDFSFNCDSVYEIGDYSIKCSKLTSHGIVDFVSAFAHSCNGAFATIGQTLDISSLYQLCEDMGYNRSLSISLLSNASKFNLTNDEFLWDVLQTSIGQGTTQITPLHNAMIAAAIANDGVMMKPYLIDSIQDPEGNIITSYLSEEYLTVMSAEESDILTELMRAVVTEGTGYRAEGSNYQVAGKTGSAEWSTDKETHAWFIGFAGETYTNPEIANRVIVEEGRSGGSVEAPIAKAVFDAYF